MNSSNQGFTLIELMVSLVLGLIIVGAAFQMLISGQRSLAFQESIQGLQDNANIGINYVADDIKLTNLNFPFTEIKPSQVSGLIVNTSNYLNGAASTTVSGEGSNSSFVSAKSDVLVIQYKPDQTKAYDCEGNGIDADDVIVQRYFIRKDDNGGANDFVLACDAGKYKDGVALSGLNGKGQIIMKGVDLFKVRVGVRDNANNMSYKTLTEFKALPNTSKAVSLQIGILGRSLDSINVNSVEKVKQNIFGTKYSITKPNGVTTKYVWIPVERTIALRNGQGEEL
ncbi:prepilin-type N-terminal cleavage/methylation domain-containing protein [Acinetobacter sp. ANC 5378]|uniref:PilW family protein n=1 Tax=Acinetobacter sp. ANC 5378 TaxID=2731249 RepID=UPI00148FC696|nr:prepilin-type N-terminal cleavage/methylation domain-containing protein [Acinetobacter sp. ANC 5378]NNG81162.1 prepilin-type N-terminal cleavage/methylation domain-containing protein [Acinetobacter sp. ANC 5378]